MLAYCLAGGLKYSLFDMASDAGNNFWHPKYEISDLPRYAKLRIFTISTSSEIKLEFSLGDGLKQGLVIKEIKKFPKSVFMKE